MVSVSGNSSLHHWNHLRFYCFFRLLVSISLVAILYLHVPVEADERSQLFGNISLLYLLFALVMLVLSFIQIGFSAQVTGQVLSDIFIISLLTWLAGSIGAGISLLLAVNATAGIILLRKQAGMAFAIVACISVIGINIFLGESGPSAGDAARTGFLVAAILATSLLALILIRRLQETEAQAITNLASLESMERLNSLIIDKMNRGVIVVDAEEQVRFINQSSWYALNLPENPRNRKISRLHPGLARQLAAWRVNEFFSPEPLRMNESGPELLPSFISLGHHPDLYLILLEDFSALTRKAQQMKLASLGQLTASIAHEIRNPLGAISHASQLLEESASMANKDRRLLDIVIRHSDRLNAIIENVMAISRREAAISDKIRLKNFLEDFSLDFNQVHAPALEWKIEVIPAGLTVAFDRSQLEQVLVNLCENSLRYGQSNPQRPKLTLVADHSQAGQAPYLDVIDDGPGIPPETADQIFEPFFTTSAQGSGLGLYLASEICEANGAQLEYIPLAMGGSCFRTTFSMA